MDIIGSYILYSAIRLTQNQNKSVLNIMVILSKKIIFWLMHHFTISICETVSQFNDNLMSQFDEGKRCNRIRTFKIFELENTRSDIKKC